MRRLINTESKLFSKTRNGEGQCYQINLVTQCYSDKSDSNYGNRNLILETQEKGIVYTGGEEDKFGSGGVHLQLIM